MNKESWLSNYAESVGSKGSVETKDLEKIKFIIFSFIHDERER